MNPFLLKLSFVLAIGAHGADLGSTEFCLGARTCSELNPWLARYQNPIVFGGVKMGTAAISEWGVYEISKVHPKVAFWMNLGLTGAFSAVAVHNGRISGAPK